MRIAYFIALLIIPVDCFSQITDAITGEIIDSTPKYMGQNNLPKDIINKTREYPKDKIVWVSLVQKEYSGDYLKLDSKIYCGNLSCYTIPLNVNISSFQVLFPTHYSRDKEKVYCYNSYICDDGNGCGACECEIFVVENANPITFRYLSNSYATDGVNVYYQGLLIKDADFLTFKVLDGPKDFDFAIDKNNVYKWNETFKDADPLTFYYDITDKRNEENKYIIGDKNYKWEYDLSKNTVIRIDK